MRRIENLSISSKLKFPCPVALVVSKYRRHETTCSSEPQPLTMATHSSSFRQPLSGPKQLAFPNGWVPLTVHLSQFILVSPPKCLSPQNQSYRPIVLGVYRLRGRLYYLRLSATSLYLFRLVSLWRLLPRPCSPSPLHIHIYPALYVPVYAYGSLLIYD